MSKYSDDIARCNVYSQRGPEEMAKMLTFVLATIQQQLETVGSIVSNMQDHGPDSKYAFGSKAAGLEVLRDRKQRNSLYSACMYSKGNPASLLHHFIQLPGLGLVKAGFACQLFSGEVGCLDTHNIKLYNVPLQTLRYPAKGTDQLKLKYIDRYIALCAALGGSEFLWKAWCRYVASARPNSWDNGWHVSEYHCEVIGC